MGILRMLGVGGEPDSQVRRLERSEQLAMRATEAMTQAKQLRKETEWLLHQALKEAAALTSTIAHVIAHETGVDQQALANDPRHAVRNKLHGVLLAMAELSEARPGDEVVDRTRATVGLLVGEALRVLDSDQDQAAA